MIIVFRLTKLYLFYLLRRPIKITALEQSMRREPRNNVSLIEMFVDGVSNILVNVIKVGGEAIC